ncbi:MAG TPA: phosphopantetheine-binding protein [Acidobacteriaceae bacterium]
MTLLLQTAGRRRYRSARDPQFRPPACLQSMSDSIQDRVLKIIANTRRIPLESVHPDSSFEELGIDSLDRLNILFDLESEFDIEIDDEEAKKVQNIPEMIAGISHLVDAKAKAAES